MRLSAKHQLINNVTVFVKTSIGKKFMRIVQQAVKSTKITYAQIKWDIDPISKYFVLGLYGKPY
jgi:hypothetical protein